MFKKNSYPSVFEITEQHDDALDTIEMEPSATVEHHLGTIIADLRIFRGDIVKLNENSKKLENAIDLMQREFADYRGTIEEKLNLLVKNTAHIFALQHIGEDSKDNKNNDDVDSTAMDLTFITEFQTQVLKEIQEFKKKMTALIETHSQLEHTTASSQREIKAKMFELQSRVRNQLEGFLQNLFITK